MGMHTRTYSRSMTGWYTVGKFSSTFSTKERALAGANKLAPEGKLLPYIYHVAVGGAVQYFDLQGKQLAGKP